MLRIQISLLILLFMESRRIFLIQQYLNYMKKIARVNHFIIKKTRRKPRCRHFIRNQGWWETVRDKYDNNRFYKTLCMSRTTFYYILKKTSDQTEKTMMTEVLILPDFRLAVTIYKFSRGDYIYTIGEMCGLAKATVCTIVSKTCAVIINTLWDIKMSKQNKDMSYKKFGLFICCINETSC